MDDLLDPVIDAAEWDESLKRTARQTAGDPDAFKFENLIAFDPALRNGCPIISGTGVTVRTIAGHYKSGLTPEEIADVMGLELAGVYAALAYYHLNKAEIEDDIAANAEITLM